MGLRCLSFDGAATPDQSATVSVSALGTAGTVEGFVRFTALPAGGGDNFQMAWMGTDASGLAIAYSHGIGVDYQGRAYGYLYAGAQVQLLSAADTIVPGRWHRLSLAWGGGTARLIVDGVEVDTESYAGTPYACTSFVLGKTAGSSTGIGGGGSDFSGVLTDFRVWSSNRTTAAMLADWNRRLAGSETGLARYFRMREGTGTTLADVLGGSAGTISNATWFTSSDNPIPNEPVSYGRMKGLTWEKIALLKSRKYNIYTHFVVTNGADAEVDYSDFFLRSRWTESVDQKVIRATVEVAYTANGQSLSPLVENSTRNTDGGGGYAPALYPGRYCHLKVAITYPYVAPTADDYITMWEGRVDRVDFSREDAIVLSCRDRGAWLEDTNIETDRVYATATNPVGTLMQSILTDNPAHPTDPVPTLRVIGDPDWYLDRHAVAQRRLMQELLDLADQIGWDLRWDWTEDFGYALRLAEPRRSVTTPDASWGPSVYKEVPVAEFDDTNVRNRLTGLYRDENGVLQTRTLNDSTSAAAFGNRWAQIAGDVIAAISTSTEMDRLLTAMLSDMKTPEFHHAYRFFFNPYAQIGDYYGFSANEVHYDADQEGAVVQIEHSLERGHGTTIVRTAGAPRSGYRRWLAKIDHRYPPALLAYALNHSPTGTAALSSIRVSEVTDELRVWARNGASPLSSGTPLDQYLVAVRKTQALGQNITWPVQDGTWQVVIRAFAGEDRYTQVQPTNLVVSGVGGGSGGGGSGGSGTAPTVAPPTPTVAAGTASGGSQPILVTMVHSNTADQIKIEYYVYAELEHSTTLAANAPSTSRSYSIASPQRVKVRIAYTNGGGDGPWSSFSREIRLG